jgi:hypothetical protein
MRIWSVTMGEEAVEFEDDDEDDVKQSVFDA